MNGAAKNNKCSNNENDDSNYQHPLPENVYSTYIKSWKNVSLAVDDR